MPKKCVVPDLGRVVEDAAGWCFVDDVVEMHGLELGTLDQIVQVRDIGLVMFAVVVLQGFTRHMWRKRIQGKWQCGKLVFHGIAFRNWTAKNSRPF